MVQLLTYRAEAGAVHAQAAVHGGLQLIQRLAAVGQGGNQLPVDIVGRATPRRFENVQAWTAIGMVAIAGMRML
ncbi:hypothetical protein D9M73_274170 [compost metagenome]